MATRSFETDAPVAYDYDYTTTTPWYVVESGAHGPRQLRTVEVPDHSADYQADRYRSGMYFVKEVS